MDFLKELELIKPVIASAAERFIMPRYRHLADTDILDAGRFDAAKTLADMESSIEILEWCKVRFPGSFTEEHLNDARFRYEIMWCIDPLDGTDEFMHQRHGFVVQGSILKKHGSVYMPEAGIIYDPIRKIFVYATRNNGPFSDRNGRIERVVIRPSARIIATQRELDRSPQLDGFYEFLRQKGLDVEVLDTGGAGSTIAQMLVGDAKPNLYIMPRPYTKEWDLSPAENIATMSGGWISDLNGNPFTYNRQNFKNEDGYIVSLGHDKQKVMSWVNGFGAHNILRPR